MDTFGLNCNFRLPSSPWPVWCSTKIVQFGASGAPVLQAKEASNLSSELSLTLLLFRIDSLRKLAHHPNQLRCSCSHSATGLCQVLTWLKVQQRGN